MRFIHNDGGRTAAGFAGTTGDCVCRSIAIAAQRPYAEVYAALNHLAQAERPRKGGKRSASRTGVFVQRGWFKTYMGSLGFRWVPTMTIGSGCKVHLRDGELPAGRLVVNVSRHCTAVIDGDCHDTHDPTRDGTRCVYGYWIHEPLSEITA